MEQYSLIKELRPDRAGFFFRFSNEEYDANTYCIYKRNGEVILRVDHNHAKEAIKSFTVFGKEYRCMMNGVAFLDYEKGREIMNMIWRHKGNARKIIFSNYRTEGKAEIAAKIYREVCDQLGVEADSFLLYDDPLLLYKGQSSAKKCRIILNLCHLFNDQIKVAIYHELRHQWQCRIRFVAEYENIKAYERTLTADEKVQWYASAENPLEEDARVFGFSYGKRNAEYLFSKWK